MWGTHAVRAIMRQRRRLPSDTHGLGQFEGRMAIVNLTGLVARWAHGLHDGLSKVGRADAAAPFALSPPFAAADPTPDDCDRLGEYVEARVQLLHDLLVADAS
jgi:hypothetical protein